MASEMMAPGPGDGVEADLDRCADRARYWDGRALRAMTRDLESATDRLEDAESLLCRVGIALRARAWEVPLPRRAEEAQSLLAEVRAALEHAAEVLSAWEADTREEER